MRILLLGEYSNVHWNLACGLRALGHEVVVASDGDGWKNYKRDVDLKRASKGWLYTIMYLIKLVWKFRKFKGYDVVQIINPVFLPLKAERIKPFYTYLRKHNRSVFMGAFGMDHYYVKACLDCKTFRYSDFNFGNTIRESAINDIWKADWLHGAKGKLNQFVAHDCDGIISGLYEYHCAYVGEFGEKETFIPFPIDTREIKYVPKEVHKKVKFFIGIQKARSEYKGTDIMLRALRKAKNDYPENIEIVKVESVPFNQYKKLLNESDVILDQLYSYTPAMNALTAMAAGMILIGGGETEAYELMGDEDLRPIVNVLPEEQSVYDAVVNLALHAEMIPTLSKQSVDYIERYHNCQTVAKQYQDFWSGNK